MTSSSPGRRYSGRTDTATLLVTASPQEVYASLTEAGALTSWLPPNGMTGEVHELDPRPGGRFRMTLGYDDARGAPGKSTDSSDVIDAHFADLVPDERVVWSVRFDSGDPAFAGVMRMTWLLDTVAGGTQVTVLAEDVPSGIGAEAHAAGLRSSLADLAAYLANARSRHIA